MRHEEILDRSVTYGDYISIAALDGWGDAEILNELSIYTFKCTKGSFREEIAKLIEQYHAESAGKPIPRRRNISG